MPIYAYRGVDKTGNDTKGTINCESEAVAKARVKAMGIMLMSMKEKNAGGKATSSLFQSKKVDIQELSLMTRQLATLVKAKIQIVEALQALVEQVDNDHLRVVLSDVKGKVNEGSSLAKAFADHPRVFDNVYVNMVEAGEASGTLEVVLLRLAEFKEAQVKLKNKVSGAMTYPLIISGAAFLIITLIFVFLIPQLTKMFEQSKKELPFLTKITIAISNFLQNYWWLLIIGVFGTIILVKWYINTDKGRRNWHATQLKLPLFGKLIQMINVSRFCSTLATLLNSGVPILASMKIVKNLIPNVWMKDAIENSRVAVSEGMSMTGPLQNSGQFPKMVTYMIKLGEKTGEVESMLEIISESYEDQVEAKLGGLTSVIEPLMMIGMGIIVGVIVFAVVVPMMELNKV